MSNNTYATSAQTKAERDFSRTSADISVSPVKIISSLRSARWRFRGTDIRPHGHPLARTFARTVIYPYELWPATPEEDAE